MHFYHLQPASRFQQALQLLDVVRPAALVDSIGQDSAVYKVICFRAKVRVPARSEGDIEVPPLLFKLDQLFVFIVFVVAAFLAIPLADVDVDTNALQRLISLSQRTGHLEALHRCRK